MGWAQRARLAEEASTATFTVRRWTAFDWRYADDDDKRAVRKNREQQLRATAIKMTRKLRAIRPDWLGEVKVVAKRSEPQLLFELQLEAAGRDAAEVKACAIIKRLLSVPVAPDRNPRTRVVHGCPMRLPTQQRTLTPPWGKMEVEPV